ncbi:hypothetical protein SAMN02745157_4849 [Kaistia soli DSM 19436]|uniref:Uncharacterized protein n=1 Tax=Kaistia soli DSM 19436 TaxID=1122133 RepID=A0A1M5MRG4_9HYPH|nr:hypothetical protein SAMN02745157_4849 [Kaistia soli DSM 19436]
MDVGSSITGRGASCGSCRRHLGDIGFSALGCLSLGDLMVVPHIGQYDVEWSGTGRSHLGLPLLRGLIRLTLLAPRPWSIAAARHV